MGGYLSETRFNFASCVVRSLVSGIAKLSLAEMQKSNDDHCTRLLRSGDNIVVTLSLG